MLLDYHVHPQGHGEQAFSEERLRQFAAAAKEGGLSHLGLADHAWLSDGIDYGLVSKVQSSYPELAISCGLEVDFFPGQEAAIRSRLEQHRLDFVLGSVHSVDGFAFDIWENRQLYADWQPDALYRRYYQLLLSLVQSGLFDILAHLDVIKVFGCRPLGDQTPLLKRLLSAVLAGGMTVELNSNGWYKPVNEQYPALDILKLCWQHGIAITLSSDAHAPEQVGREVAHLRSLAWQTGYRQVAVYRQRQRLLLPL